MRKEFRTRTPAAQHTPKCTCRPIRWSSPVLNDVDTVELPCLALAPNLQPEVAPAEPRRTHQVSAWDWTSAARTPQRRPNAA